MINLKIKAKLHTDWWIFHNVCFIKDYHGNDGVRITIYNPLPSTLISRACFDARDFALNDIVTVIQTTREKTVLDKAIIAELRAILAIKGLKIIKSYKTLAENADQI